MTRSPVRRRLLALALAAALTGQALAQNFEAFTVSDIRVDGLQRISAGTVYSYLPVEKGDLLDGEVAVDGTGRDALQAVDPDVGDGERLEVLRQGRAGEGGGEGEGQEAAANGGTRHLRSRKKAQGRRGKCFRGPAGGCHCRTP